MLPLFMFPQAYTEPTDANAAMINCGIVVMTALGVFMKIKGDSDKVWNDEQTQALCQKVLLSMGRVFQLLQDQMHMASKIIVQQVHFPPCTVLYFRLALLKLWTALLMAVDVSYETEERIEETEKGHAGLGL